MDQRQLISFLDRIEKLKCNTRHSWTSTGRRESVAEHSFRLAFTAMLCRDEYTVADIDRVIRMCLVHDIGEAVLGDIPSFEKTDGDFGEEDKAVNDLLSTLPDTYRDELSSLYSEFRDGVTAEAKLCRALDNLEAVLQHNEAPLDTWLPLEYELQLRYGVETAAFSEWTRGLKRELNNDTLKKTDTEGRKKDE